MPIGSIESNRWTTTGRPVQNNNLYWRPGEPVGSEGRANILQAEAGYAINGFKPENDLSKFICALPGQ